MEKQYQNETWLRNKYILEKLSTTEIGKLCGDRNKETIRCWLKRYDIPIRSMNERHKGQEAWNKGLTKNIDIRVALSEETRKRISKGNKGHLAWNKNIPHSEETKMKISKATRGENGNNWKGGISSLILLVR